MIRLRLRSVSFLIQTFLIALLAFHGMSFYPAFSRIWWVIAALVLPLFVLVSLWPVRQGYQYAYLALEAALLLGLTAINPEFMFLGIILGPPAFLLLPFRTAIILLSAYSVAMEILVTIGDNFSQAIYPGLAEVIATFSFGYIYYLQEQAEEGRDRTQALLDELRLAHQKLATYAAQVEELSAAEERNRLARDLHDSVKQQAFAASAQLGTAQALLESSPSAARDHLQQAETLLDEIRRELGQMIYELRPVAFQNQGFASGLREWGKGWSQQSNILLDIHVQGERSLAPETEQALFRITQEALSNIARHSQAKAAEIHLRYEPESLLLMICDDGQGFNPLAPDTGIGLRSMRERAERLPGGVFEIASTPNHGTIIRVECAL
jgi:signal transduction histidine kinase